MYMYEKQYRSEKSVEIAAKVNNLNIRPYIVVAKNESDKLTELKGNQSDRFELSYSMA